MKWSFATIGIFILGLIGIVAIFIIQNLTTDSESDYYLLKEVTEAAMYDSIDIGYYRENRGEVRIVKEKFVENFVRRFAEVTHFNEVAYNVKFYKIMEYPPKASIFIDTDTNGYRIFGTENYNSQNNLDAIFEYLGGPKKYNTGSTGLPEYCEPNEFPKTYYSIIDKNDEGYHPDYLFHTDNLNIPDELNIDNIKEVTIKNVIKKDIQINGGTISMALLSREIDFKNLEDSIKNLSYYTPSDKFNEISIEGIQVANSKEYTIRWMSHSTINNYGIASYEVTWKYYKCNYQ